MDIERIGTDEKGLYSDVTKGNGEIFLSAQVADDLSCDIVEQTKQACKKCLDLLEKADADVSNVVKVSMYVPEQSNCEAAINVVADVFGKAKPAFSCICVDLEDEQMLVKLDVDAYKR